MTRRNRPSAGSPEARQDSVAATPAFAPNDWFFAAALVAAVFLAYQPAWQGGLLVDDHLHLGAPELHSWHGLYRIWFDLGATQQYYPLLETAFWVEHNLWGPATLGYHLVNILLHALAALMVALVPATAQDPRGLPGRGHLRAAPRTRRIRGLDFGAKEHALGRVLHGRRDSLSALR